MESFWDKELSPSLNTAETFAKSKPRKVNLQFDVAQIGAFGLPEILLSKKEIDPLHSFSLQHDPQMNRLPDTLSAMASDVSHELSELVPARDLLWHYDAQPLLLLSELKPSKPQKTLQSVIDLTTGQIVGVEEVAITEHHGSALDSTSLMREPSQLEDFARGSSEYYPFKPGGLKPSKDEIVEDPHKALSKEDYVINFDDDKLLTTLPLCEKGITFSGEKPMFITKNVEAEKKPQEKIKGSLASYKDLYSEQENGRQFFKSLYNERARAFQGRVALKEEIKTKVSQLPAFEASSDSEEVEIIEEIEYVEGSFSGSEEEIVIIEEEYIVEEDEEEPEKKKEEIVLCDKKAWARDLKPASDRADKKYQWAVQENRDMSDFHELVPELAIEYPFEMDFFQKEAVYRIEQGDSVFVAAHTSAGKTVVAEYAIALSLRHMTRVVYTSPIKALSNQKFRDFKDVFENVGLITGDVSVKPDAACLVLTTEILRSMLYKGADLVRDLEWVIFDEVHYINDPDRGVVWEEVIIMLPDHVGLIFLSATVPNTFEFADWVGRTKKKKVFIVSTNKRPVPLEHYLYANEDTFKIVDKTGSFLHAGYTAASKSFKPKKETNKPKPQNNNRNVPTSNRGSYIKLCQTLKDKNLLPAVVFVFSKKRCTEFAEALTSVDFNSRSESGEVHVFVQKSLMRLKGDDKSLPQVLTTIDLLKRGIGVHHGGLLPIIKEMTEILFSKGLIKVLFATETFAMGVNMPARTVVFNETAKYCGNLKRNRDLMPGEYTQMSGRAGRRGIDNVGVVLICAWHEIPEPSSLQTMLTGKALKLESQFRLTFNMILNLLRMSGEFRVEDMMKRSFSESSTSKLADERKMDLKKGEKLIRDMEDIYCEVNKDLNPPPCLAYYKNTKGLDYYKKAMFKYITDSNFAKDYFCSGRVIVVNNKEYVHKLGLILRVFKVTGLSIFKQDNTKELTYQVMILNDLKGKDVYKNIVIPANDMGLICREKLKVNDELILDKYNQQHIQETVKSLEKISIAHLPAFPPELDPVADLKIKDYEFNRLYMNYHQAKKEINESPCHTCPHRDAQFQKVQKQQELLDNVENIRFFLSEDSLLLKPEFECRVSVLKKLNFINEERIIQLKGKVARELSTCDELIGTELIFENILNTLEPTEIAALISSLVFQEKTDSPCKVSSQNLQIAQESLLEIGNTLAKVQIDCGMQIDPLEYIAERINVGLMEIVYAWAKGVAFSEICAMTTVPEGSIVRTIVRLDETMRDFKSAAKIIGEYSLANKMEQASALIKRDIVFASSLYVS